MFNISIPCANMINWMSTGNYGLFNSNRTKSPNGLNNIISYKFMTICIFSYRNIRIFFRVTALYNFYAASVVAKASLRKA